MLKTIQNLLSFARQKKELLVLFKSKEWVYIGFGDVYDTIWLDVQDRRYIVCVSLTTVHITLLNKETGKFAYRYSVSPKSWFFNALDLQVFLRSHKKTKKVIKSAKAEMSKIQELVLVS